MRILILSQTFPLTPSDSTAHFMYDFARGFSDIGHDVFVLVPFHPQLQTNSFKKVKIYTFRYIWPDFLHLLGFGRTLINDQLLPWYNYLLAPFYLFFGSIALWRLVKRERIEVMNAHWLIPNGILAALVSKVTGIPAVYTMPGSDVYLAQMNFLFKWLAQFSLKQAKEVVSNSPQLLADLKVKGKVISYGVPVQIGNQSRKVGMASRKIVVATAGRMVEKKGFEFLQSVYPDIEIIFGLPIDKFRKRLFDVDIFVAPSIRDSRGNLDDASLVVLEAMAVGCPVIVSDLQGYRKIITDGQDGLLVSPNVKKAWVTAIERCKKSKTLRQKLGNSARVTVKSLFTPEKIALKYTEIFRN